MASRPHFQGQIVWGAIRTLQHFTPTQLIDACRLIYPQISRASITRYYSLLRDRGYIQSTRRGHYHLVKDAGLYAPVVTSENFYDPNSQGLDPQTRIWRVARILRRFSAGELAATAEVKESQASNYLHWLSQGQFVVCLNPKGTRSFTAEAIYQLARDTGPIAPFVAGNKKTRFMLFDANRNEFINLEERKNDCPATRAHSA